MSSAATQTRGSGTTEPQGLTITGVRKVYSSRGRETFEAVKGMDMEIRPGELISLLGPSGCGKTTTLRMIAGLETITSGDIHIGDRRINDLPPGKRQVGVGFESYALYPPLNVRENLAYGLKARKVPNADALVDELARRLEMTDLLDLRPANLSSGRSSASLSRGRSSASLRSSSSTSRWGTSTPRRGPGCAANSSCCSASSATRRSSSRTTSSRRSRSRTASR